MLTFENKQNQPQKDKIWTENTQFSHWASLKQGRGKWRIWHFHLVWFGLVCYECCKLCWLAQGWHWLPNVPNLIGRQHANYADLASNTGRGRTMKRLEANTAEKNPGQKVEQPPSVCAACYLHFLLFTKKLGKVRFNAMRRWRIKETVDGCGCCEFWKLWRKVCSLTGLGTLELPRPHWAMLWLAPARISRRAVCGAAAEKGIALHRVVEPGKMHCKPIACIPFTPQAQKTPFSDEFTAVQRSCKSRVTKRIWCVLEKTCSSQLRHVQTFVSKHTWALKWYH